MKQPVKPEPRLSATSPKQSFFAAESGREFFSAAPGFGTVQAMFDPEVEEEEKKIEKKESVVQARMNPDSNPAPMTSGKSSGRPLSGNVKGKMERSFNADFSDVTVHRDSPAAERLGALAFAQGNQIHFAPKQFNANTRTGQELIGHELTHVVQQRQGRVGPGSQFKGANVNDSPTLEKEADTAGKQAAAGQRVRVIGQGEGIQKKGLTAAESAELRRITGNRIDKAYTDFVDAAEQVKSEVHKAVQANKDFVFFIADIALGYLLPGAGKALAKWANEIPNTASNATFRAALALVDEAKTTRHLTSATKVGTQALKKNYNKLTNLSKIDAFIAKMKTETRDGFDQTDANLPNLSDMELASTYLAFRTQLTNATTYKTQIRNTVNRFKSQVLEIGDSSYSNTTVPHSETRTQVGVLWLEYETDKWVLSKVKIVNKSTLKGQNSTHMYFLEMIDKDMGPLSRQAGIAKQKRGIQDLRLDKQAAMKKYGYAHNFPTHFPPGKYYFVTKK